MDPLPITASDPPPFPERFYALSPNLLCVIGFDGRIKHLNDSWTRLLGFLPAELKDQSLLDLVHPDDRAATAEAAQALTRGRELFAFENRLLGKDDSCRWLLWNATALADQRLIYAFAVDITARKAAEEKLAASQEELRRLAGYLQNVREQERTAIARDLHDELGQQLSTLEIDITCLQSQLGQGQEAVAAGLRDMEARLDDAVKTVQRLATGLRPSLLDDLGLAAAMEWQAKDFAKHTRTPCRISIEPEAVSVNPDLATALFRILQETLTNVARHAEARQVTVELRQNPEGILLTVTDDGRGIDPARLTSPQSLGLIGMRERLRAWDGQLDIQGQPGRGTTVRVRVPADGGRR
ncbi:MAG TPA: ATP-binding protein [Elusimicrobiota bacterium]|nr:ATP-binding protein [Elusimicrobiota bacterium]